MAASKPPALAGRKHPLSFAQEQLWFLDQLAPGETAYNILMTWRLRGPLRVEVLQRCLDLVVARHDALRTTIRQVDDVPYQVVAPATRVPLEVTDLSGLPAAGREERVRAAIDEQRAEPYDLETGPLYRFRLMRLDAEEYVLCQGFHHIIMDGWSAGLANAELSSAYRSLCAGAEPVFEDADLDYIGFAESQRERLHGEALAEELAFWREKLAGVPVLELPADRPRVTSRGHRGETLIRDFAGDVHGIVHQLAERHGASPFMVLAAAYTLVLSRCTGLEDVPIGVPMLGRPEPELEDVVGMFVNMTVLRCDLSGDPAFSELIDRVADGTMELYDHQEAPFNQVVDAVRPPREPNRNPLFQVSLQLLGASTSGEDLDLDGMTAEWMPLVPLGSRFDIATTIVDTGSSLRAAVEYSSDMFDAWRMEDVLAHVETVLRRTAADPGLRLSQIPVTGAAESARLLAAGLGEAAGGTGQLLHVAVADVALKQPEAVAVAGGGCDLTYGELDRRAGLLAGRLRENGLRAGQVVVVVADRSSDVCVALLGVLKAGGAYTVLAPQDTDRLAFVMGDTMAELLVAGAGQAGRLPEPVGWRLVLLDGDQPARGSSAPPVEPVPDPGATACVVHTADPSGHLTGVVISHRTLSSACEGHRRPAGPDGGPAPLPPLSSVRGQAHLWAALTSGATLAQALPGDAAGPGADALADGSGADALHPGPYGPPEAPASLVGCDAHGSVPVVRPHANRQVYVVDRSLNLVPRGVIGELLITGEPGSLADGYLNQPELTAARFVDDPFRPGRPAFRTGVPARWSADLRLELPARAPGSDGATADTDAPGPDEPGTPTERDVVGIFSEVLSLPVVGVETSFFDAGGNSLQAMRAVSRINKKFRIKLSVRALYGNVTARAVAAVVDETAGGSPA